MEQMIMDTVSNIFVILATALAGMMVAWLKQKLGVEGIKKVQAELAAKQELACLAVQFVEQAYKDLKGPEKYDAAAGWLAAQAAERGLKVTPGEVQGLIEVAVKAMNEEIKKLFG